MDSLLGSQHSLGRVSSKPFCSSRLAELHVTAHIGKAARVKAQHPNHCLPGQIFFGKLFWPTVKCIQMQKRTNKFTVAPRWSTYKQSTYFQVREISLEESLKQKHGIWALSSCYNTTKIKGMARAWGGGREDPSAKMKGHGKLRFPPWLLLAEMRLVPSWIPWPWRTINHCWSEWLFLPAVPCSFLPL